MKILKASAVALISCLVFCACGKDFNEPPQPVIFPAEFGYSYDLQYVDTLELRTYQFLVGETTNVIGQIEYGIIETTFSTGDLGPSLTVENGHNVSAHRNDLKLQFWPEDFSSAANITKDALESFFAAGNTFSFGQGPGKVDLMVLLPRRSNEDYKISRASYLPEPRGELVVESIEHYSYTFYDNGPEESRGKIVKCAFSGAIGRYDQSREMVGQEFQTDEAVEVLNGEIIFYFEYARI